MAPAPERYDIIVAGGGQVGLTLAVALARVLDGELRIAVVDPGPMAIPAASTIEADVRASALGIDARASALGAGSRRLFEAIGVWGQLADAAQDIDTVDITDLRLSDGVRPILLSYATRLDDGEPAMTIVPNGRLSAALVKAARAAPGVRLLAGTRIAATERGANGVALQLGHGPTLLAPLLVAADGRGSAQREAAGIKCVRWGHAQIGIVTLIDHKLPHRAHAVQHFLPGGPFAILPLPGQRSCITWSEATPEATRLLALSDAAFLDALERRVGGRLGRLRLAGPRQAWPLETFLARELVAERLALVGDAARGVHPIAGQGLNLGLRDVAALVEVVASAARTGQDFGSLAILGRYAQWRRADGVMAASAFDGLNRLFSNDSALLRALRGAGLGIVDRWPGLKQRLVDEAAGLTGDLPPLLQRRAGI